MAKTIVNLTLPIVIEEIEQVLDEVDNQFYRQTFSIPDLHQELVVYVLSRIRNRYSAVDQPEDAIAVAGSLSACVEERLKIDDLAFQGIHHILQLHRLIDRPLAATAPIAAFDKHAPMCWAG
jgi:hypothetical protein